MSDSSPDFDVSQLQSDIHGDPVVSDPICDYCHGPLDTDRQVMYDVIRVAELTTLSQLFDLPARWFPDAARCQACERETIDPATAGFDEALIRVQIAGSEDSLWVDPSPITVIDFSSAGDGYHPPHYDLQMVARHDDPGMARWIRVKKILEYNNEYLPGVTKIRDCVDKSWDVPPDIP